MRRSSKTNKAAQIPATTSSRQLMVLIDITKFLLILLNILQQKQAKTCTMFSLQSKILYHLMDKPTKIIFTEKDEKNTEK